MDRTELAWAAGFWDGEGWTNLVRFGRGDELRPMARVNQSDVQGVPVVLERFKAAIGVGAISGPEITNGREPLYKWVASSRDDVGRVGDLLSPWLGRVKREQFESVLGRALHDGWPDATEAERRAWAAGLWDGEGSICLLKHRSHVGHFVPEAAVTQSSASGPPEVLTRLASIGPNGSLYGPFPQPEPWRPVYRWKLFRQEEIRHLMDLMQPWLGPAKVDQARRIFAVLEAQPKLPCGNPAWGANKTHCVNGHEYATARMRPYRARKPGGTKRRDSKQCLACVREQAREKRRTKNERSRGSFRGS